MSLVLLSLLFSANAQDFGDAFEDTETSSSTLNSAEKGDLDLILQLEKCKQTPETDECQEFFIQYGEDLGVDREKYIIKDKPESKTTPVQQQIIEATIEPTIEATIEPKNYRLSLGLNAGSFSYQQTPTRTDGLLYEKPIILTRQVEGSSSALTVGWDIRAVGTIPSIDFLGFDVHVQSDQYAIALSEFPEPVEDWMTSIDAMASGQYAYPLSGLIITPSVRVGLIRDDLIVFRQDVLDDGNIALSYEPLIVSAVNVGLGTEIQTDMGIFTYVTYDLGLKGDIYRKKFDSQIGYNINDGLFGFLGLRSTTRNIDIETTSGKSGEILDYHASIVLGLGIR